MNMKLSHDPAPIGVFDSGFGGLSVLREIRKTLPQYDYLFIGDNARAPYGVRSFQLVYDFTRQCVDYLFQQGCNLVILACNTASAKALRSIQQHDLPLIDPTRRVLGVIRPTVEKIGEITKTGNIGIFGTPGTIQSKSYDIEIAKMYPHFHVYGHPCPMWVPLVENRESEGPGADYFVKKDIDALLAQCSDIDTVILGCTHYPLLMNKIRQYMPQGINIIAQGEIVAESLEDYLRRHPEMEKKCSKGSSCTYCTTEEAEKFNTLASIFVNEKVEATHVTL
ncbi:MAG: glutamate racemase [Bacteroidales bacterium]|jgi:glutamate racemase|uniref:glutamate racemase n=1 Tax=Sodaliphilus pleomorphus TaxID=2606626 RepID=UPI00240981EA|nr:glutamate racemase [Sodaliphilus pleomorphus]MCI6170060.1 glutamate racemase [Muribaculaceae bacterium]MDD6686722.1 glutamate racemase [Sodaliphilus pleomorphus]MDY6252191.1 glutamate racemase [Bacteroidales bacterium]